LVASAKNIRAFDPFIHTASIEAIFSELNDAVTYQRMQRKADFEQNRQASEMKDTLTKAKGEEAKREQERIKKEEQNENLKAWLQQLASHLGSDSYQEHLQKRHDTTGNWFVSEVKLWLKERKEGVLWGVGNIGMGKSVLASTVLYYRQEISEVLRPKRRTSAAADGALDDLYSKASDARADGDTETVDDTAYRNAVAHVFLTDDESENQNPVPVLASLLLQIYESMDTVKDQLIKVAEDNTKTASSGRNVTKLLHKLTEIVISLPRYVLLVFDALDEANAKMRTTVENILRGATTKQGPRILIMSRPDVQVTSIADMSEDTVFKVPINGYPEDISMYVESSLRNHKGVMDIIKRTFPDKGAIEQQLNELAAEVKESSDGM
jgi:hypothetical protein